MLATLALFAQLNVAIPVDTPVARPRPRAVEVSDWYARRLALHRGVSYAILPVFAFQYAAGSRIWSHGPAAPAWAKTGHRVGATTLAVLFTTNTVTGAWNLWDSRGVPEGRALRYAHAISMLAADAGFTWAGAVLSEQAERSTSSRRLHRTVALTSMGVSITSGVLMKLLND